MSRWTSILFVANEEGVFALDVKILLRPAFVPMAQEAPSCDAKSLGVFFAPRSMAVIGASATPGKSGHVVVKNILANGFEGKIYLVNPKGGEILGLPVHSSITDLPDGIDLAIIVLPAKETPQALRECAEKGIRHAVLLAGGFAEVDHYGAEIQRRSSPHPRKRNACHRTQYVRSHVHSPSVHLILISPGEDPPGKGLLYCPDRKLCHAYDAIYFNWGVFWGCSRDRSRE